MSGDYQPVYGQRSSAVEIRPPDHEHLERGHLPARAVEWPLIHSVRPSIAEIALKVDNAPKAVPIVAGICVRTDLEVRSTAIHNP